MRIRIQFAVMLTALLVTLPQPGKAQNIHFVAAGDSDQWQSAAVAADQLALNENNGPYLGLGYTIAHWTFTNGGSASDNRDPLSRILPQLGNIWVVWIETPAGVITDLWLTLSTDSAVAVRLFSAQEKNGSGGQISIIGSILGGTAGQNLIGAGFWPDGEPADTPIPQSVVNIINANGGLHVNAALTALRPEDALAATRRALAAVNVGNWSGLGYVGPTNNIGAPILGARQACAGSNEVIPVTFALSGHTDPFNRLIVPAYTAIPVGAAPLVFVTNNAGAFPLPITNLISGVTPGVHVSGQVYPAEQLFAGLVPADTQATAFGGNGNGNGTPLTLFLQTPISGAMNTAEYDLFRTWECGRFARDGCG